MKTRANLQPTALALLGVILCFASFVSAAESSKNVSTYNQTTGAVKGKLTGTFGNQVVYGLGETVTLTPSSGGRAIKTKTDAEGWFLFQNVPPGQYELGTRFEWTSTYVECDEAGSPDRMYVDHSRELVGRVQVKPHQTARVTTYTVGPTHDAFYAYGGNLSKPHHPLVSDDWLAWGYPILTFTNARTDILPNPNSPSAGYVKMIASWIKETYPQMSDDDVVGYLSRADGIRGNIDLATIKEWLAVA